MNIRFLMALNEGIGEKCRMTDVFIFFEALYLSAAGGRMMFTRRPFLFVGGTSV